MKISVIVPVYNVENYIVECLNSILNQTFEDIEVIIVNDGSTDNSMDKIKKIIKGNNNIQVINKNNGGLSSARNEGLMYAKGEYVIFIDSDDFIETDFLQNLYREAKQYNLDIACGGYKKFFSEERIEEKKRKEKIIELGVVEGNQFLLAQLENQDYRMEVWDDLYRREFLLNNNLIFTEDLLHEDEEFTPKSLLLAKRVKLVNTYGYLYRQRENSITTSKTTIKNIESIYYIIYEFKKMFDQSKNDVEKKCLSQLICIMIDIYFCKIHLSNELQKFDLAKKLNIYKITRDLDKNHLTFKQKLKYNIPYLALLNFKRLELL
ncbi:Hyaluronan synthase [Turicibacter sanguinis]|nr:Hyaluronan synthase [Turicibacter sanguinis]